MSAVHPILFSGPMVCAILDGRKRQTRRLLKPQPITHHWRHFRSYRLEAMMLDTSRGRAVRFRHSFAEPAAENTQVEAAILLPYGQPGDLLWVRETCYIEPGTTPDTRDDDAGDVLYRADGGSLGNGPDDWAAWRPSIHMPRWASRLTLEIADVRIERLQDISEDDARAEGIAQLPNGQWHWANHEARLESHGFEQHGYHTARGAFEALWSDINGTQSWSSNPWVVALTFHAHNLNIDAAPEVLMALKEPLREKAS